MNVIEQASLPACSPELPLQGQWDRRALRQAFGQFATGVTVITTRDAEGRSIGLTANSFNTLSLEPALVLWSLGITQGSSAAFKHSAHFAINILSAGQLELSRRFSSPVEDRFAGVDCVQEGLAAPLIRGCAAWLICRQRQHMQMGDHLLFIGEVERLGMVDEQPLLFHNGNYAFAQGTCSAQAHASA